MLVAFFLMACDNPIADPFVISIEVDPITIASDLDINEFDISNIQLLVRKSNGSASRISLMPSMLSVEDLLKLQTIGTHMITARYETATTTFTVTIKGSTLQMQLVAIYNQGIAEELITGSYEEWLESIQGEDGVSIVSAAVNPEGYLILTLSNSQTINAGIVKGQDGTNGKDACLRISDGYIQWQLNGETIWNNLIALADLTGPVGASGNDGIGILSISISDNGELIITQTNQTETNLGNIIGSDGIGITSAVINELGHLIITYSNQETIDLGLVVGNDGMDANDILLNVQDGILSWKYEDELEWKELFALSLLIGPQGDPGNDGLEVTMQVANGYIQWKYVGESLWQDLIAISTLIGPKGDQGTSGREIVMQVNAGWIAWKYSDEYSFKPLVDLMDLIGPTGATGMDGLEVVLRVAGGYIQWQYEGDYDWNNLIEISTLIGPKGDSGKEFIMRVYNGNIEWQYVGDLVWNQLISLTSLVGPQGEPGMNGSQIVLQVDRGYIQWKYDNSVTWENLIEIATLVGETGATGASGEEVLLQVLDGYIKWKYTSDVLWTPLIEIASLIGPKGEQGNPGNNAEAILLQVQGGYIQWKYELGIEWTNLISMESLIGPTGPKGDTGDAGKQVVFRVSTGFIQWKYESDLEWNNLVSLELLIGPQGEAGLSAYQLYLIQHPEYTKTESEWMYDLANGLLSERAMYMVTFNPMGGELPEGYEPIIFIEASNTISLPIPTKMGYTFEGWYSGLTVNDGKITNITPIQTNMTVYAKWRVSDYFVVFFDHDGTFIKMVGAHSGEDVTPPNNPSRVGYTFLGWSHELNNITESKIIYAQYSINQYTLSYMLQTDTPITFVKLGIDQFGGIALSEGGKLYIWGIDYSGKFLGGTNATYLVPTILNSRIPFNENEVISDASCSDTHCILLTSQNRILTFGYNGRGQLGNGTTQDSFVPIDITGQFHFQHDETVLMVNAKVQNTSILTSAGRLFLWGMNSYGTVGNGGGSDQLIPLDITSYFNLRSEEVIISTQFGYMNVGTLTNQGRVFMWGYNDQYSVGNGSEGFSYYPPSVNYPLDITNYIDLSEDEMVTQLNVHYYHTHVITNMGNIFGWGSNWAGQVGNGTTLIVITPTKITDNLNLLEGEQITSIEGSFHNFAITSFNRILSWGYNNYGQLGDGTQNNASTPIDVTSNLLLEENEFIQLLQLGNSNTYLITNKGRHITWGENSNSNLGKGNFNYYDNPHINPQLYKYSLYQVVEEDYGTTINYPTVSQLGYTFSGWFTDFHYTMPSSYSVVPANNLDLYGKLIANQYEISFESNGGSPVSSIVQDYGTDVYPPISPVKEDYTFENWYIDSSLEIPYVFTTMSASNITLYAKWQLAYFANESIIMSKSSYNHVVALTVDNEVYTWGINTHGQLGTGDNVNATIPQNITSRFDLSIEEVIVKVDAGREMSVALTSLGRVFTWGYNGYGQLGNNTLTGSNIPIDITSYFSLTADEIIQDIYGEANYTIYALSSKHYLYVWGRNFYGSACQASCTNYSLLTPLRIDSSFPLEVGEVIDNVYSNSSAAYVLTSFNNVYGWGSNYWGNFGNGTADSAYICVPSPVLLTNVISLTEGEVIIDVVAGPNMSYFVTSTGRLFGSGYNTNGQLGVNYTSFRISTKTEITSNFGFAEAETILKIGVGNGNSVLLTNIGRVFVWGSGLGGILGTGDENDVISPLDITALFDLEEGDHIKSVYVGIFHSYAYSMNGVVFVWGNNALGLFGDGTFDSSLIVKAINQ